ncbi:MAG TPA: hypothetical protein VGG69_10640 [Rhizomicrobium sp.]
MNKIPVRQTVSYAYSFTFGQIGTIIGLCWLPLVVIAVLQFLPYALGGNPLAPAENATALGRQELQSLATSLLVLLLYAIMCVPVTRQALGLRQGGAIVHFAIGMPEFRAFGALLLFFLMTRLMELGISLLSLLIGRIAQSAGGALAGFVLALGMLAAVAAFVYAIARLGFVLLPVTVAENQVSLTRAWMLTKGNFWRILGVALAVLLPLYLLYIVGLSIIVGPDMANSPAAAGGASEAFTATLRTIGRHMPEYLGLTLILAPFNIGLSLGAAAFAYRALVPTAGPIRATPAA